MSSPNASTSADSNPPLDAESLADIERIKQLKARYFRLLDTKQWDELRLVFADDFRFFHDRSPMPIAGSEPAADSGDAFVAMVSDHLADAVTIHHGHTPEIRLLGPERAAGVWAMYDWVDVGSEFAIRGFGHYHDQYRVVEGSWRIAESRLTRIRRDRVDPMPSRIRPVAADPWTPSPS